MKKNSFYIVLTGAIFLITMVVLQSIGLVCINKEDFCVARVTTALAAAAVSIGLPGMIEIKYNSQGQALTQMNREGEEELAPMTLAEKKPEITASGALAIFVIVYLFNPIG